MLRAVDSVADNRLTTKVLEWSDKLAGRKSTQNMAGKMGKAARPSDNVAAARPTDSYAQPEKLGMKGVWNNVKDQASKLLGSAADRDRQAFLDYIYDTLIYLYRPPNRRRVLKKKPPKGVYRDPHAKELEKTYTGPREPNTLPSSWSDETVHRMPKEITSKLKNLSSRFTRERDTATTAPSSSRRSSINSVDSRTRRVSVNSHGSVVAMYVPDASRIRSPPNSPASPSSGSRVGSIPSLLPGSSDTSSNLLTPPIGAGDIWAGKKRRSSVHL